MSGATVRGREDAEATITRLTRGISPEHPRRNEVMLSAMLLIVAEKLTDNADFARGGKPYEADYLRAYGKAVREWTKGLGYP